MPDLLPSSAFPSPLPAFAVVGLGASAGGLEALERFLAHVPASCGMAFVVVQHLDPTHPDLLVELLQRATPMPVLQVTDGLKLQPGQVHVIPPNRDLSLHRGRLHLLEPVAPRGLRLPIDFFFRSLALDRGNLAVGVVLSGMGSDGALGLRAIKDAGGLAFAQSPATAKFDGMPACALEAGLADAVGAPEELPERILAALSGGVVAAKDQASLDKIVVILRDQTGHDFSRYKKPTIHRRIERRMGLHQMSRLQDYVRYLRENPGEVERLFQELLIGVTQFFRDPEAWDHLRDEVLPQLFAANPQGTVFRAWTPGCSTGEEAYSLAMAFREAQEGLADGGRFSLLIFATDLDKHAIDRARQGVFPATIEGDVGRERLERFFVPEERGYRVGKAIREMVIFAPQNIAMDPPFTKLDILTCRNLLIYLDAELQQKLLPLFHYSLKSKGVLFLGSAETIGAATELFAPLDRKFRLYRRLDRQASPELLAFPSRLAHRRPEAPLESAPLPKGIPMPPNLQALTSQFLLQRYVPSAVMVGPEGDILFTSGRTGTYLEPSVGTANLNIFAMAREGLGPVLSEGFHRARHEPGPIALRQVKVATNGGTQFVDIQLEAFVAPEAMKGNVMIIFSDAPPLSGACSEASFPEPGPAAAFLSTGERELQEALRGTQAELARTREEMQTSREELKSTNEELQSINEELQSTNEELTTSKEEMQSMNEELQTVNHELQAKVDELSWVNNDLKNLLNATDIATLFLDEAFRIRRFTTQAAAISRLLPGDVGRPITDITTLLVYPQLIEDAQGVLETLAFKERRVVTLDHRWFTVRVMPYRTSDNRIDGVVITFSDVTLAQALEEAHQAMMTEIARLRAELAQRVPQP